MSRLFLAMVLGAAVVMFFADPNATGAFSGSGFSVVQDGVQSVLSVGSRIFRLRG